MIWDLKTIRNVSRLYCQTTVDLLRPDPEEAKKATRIMSAEKLQRLGKLMFDVTLHLADIQFKENYDDSHGRVEISAAWRPSTKAVEFHHGPRDGELMVVDERLLFTRIVLPYQSGVTYALGGDLKLEPLVIQHLAYDYAGWNEAQRRWIYRFVK
jgi:hypothetical protein